MASSKVDQNRRRSIRQRIDPLRPSKSFSNVANSEPPKRLGISLTAPRAIVVGVPRDLPARLCLDDMLALGGARPGGALRSGLPVAERGSTRDFVEYWSAARLFIEGGNPYSPDELIVLQRTAGWGGVQPLIMWNPPWALPLVLPFGIADFTTGQMFWLVLHVWLILISAQVLWRIYNDADSASRFSWVLALTFVPVVFVLVIGQITPLTLAGLALFLHGERKQKYWAWGASLVLLSIKPHVLYLFWIVLLFWIFDRRPRRLLFSAALFGLGALLLPLLFHPEIYSKYLVLYGAPGIDKPMDWPAPTLRNVIRIFFGTGETWLQIAPTVIAAGWSIYHWTKHRHQWLWREQLPLLCVVSVSTSIFLWTYDHADLAGIHAGGGIDDPSHEVCAWVPVAARLYGDQRLPFFI